MANASIPNVCQPYSCFTWPYCYFTYVLYDMQVVNNECYETVKYCILKGKK